jgi:predicted DNA-binding transcriptional regulator YafY
MNRIDRLFAIALLLQSKRVLTGDEIARHFEVSLRTVYRDMTALSEAGIPVVAEAGVGYSLMKGYFLPPVAFTEEEAQAIAIGAALAAKFGGSCAGEAAKSAQLKIQSILPGDAKERVSRLARQTAVLSNLPSPGTKHLPVCGRAVADRRVLRLQYTAQGNGETDRIVEPLGAVLHEHFWYLVAWCRLRRDYRSFRLDRVRSAELLDERFTERHDFDLETHLRAAFEANGVERVRLWFANSVVERATSELGACVKSRRRRNGGEEIIALVWGYEWISRWLLSFGNNARVLAPNDLHEAVRARVAELAHVYPSKDC